MITLSQLKKALSSLSFLALFSYIVYELDSWASNQTNKFAIIFFLLDAIKLLRNGLKQILFTMVVEQHLMEVIHGVLVNSLLKMLGFLVLRVNHEENL